MNQKWIYINGALVGSGCDAAVERSPTTLSTLSSTNLMDQENGRDHVAKGRTSIASIAAKNATKPSGE